MSYYGDNAQWSSQGQNNWDHQASPARSGKLSSSPLGLIEPQLTISSAASATGPTPQDDYAFGNQFDGT